MKTNKFLLDTEKNIHVIKYSHFAENDEQINVNIIVFNEIENILIIYENIKNNINKKG